MPKPAPEVSINVPLPAELHRRLRIAAVTDGITLRDAVTAAVEAWVGPEAPGQGRAS